MACAPCPCPDPHAGRGIFQKLGDKGNKSHSSLQHHCHCICFGTITLCCELTGRATRAQMMLFPFLILRKQQAFPRCNVPFPPCHTRGVQELLSDGAWPGEGVARPITPPDGTARAAAVPAFLTWEVLTPWSQNRLPDKGMTPR